MTPAPDDGSGVPRRSRRDGALFPTRLLDTIAEVSRADVITIYLSEPGSPFVRSSYQILATRNIDPRYAPHMRGPLAPHSITLFSATDELPTKLIPDVTHAKDWEESRFARVHRVRSLIRLSVRTKGFEKISRIVLMPTLLEVFLSYTEARTEPDLAALADETRKLLERERRAITTHEPLLKLLNPRATAAKFRRLDQIALNLAQDANLAAARPARHEAVRKAFEQLSHFVIDCCGLPTRGAVVTWHVPYEWRPERPEPALIHAFGRIGDGPDTTGQDVFRPLATYVSRTLTSVVVKPDDGERWRRLVPRLDGAKFALSVPLFSARKLAGILSFAAAEMPPSTPSLWRMIPLIERVLNDSLAHEAIEDAIEGRSGTHRLATMPMIPRETALDERLRYLAGHLHADAALIISPDEVDREARVWRRNEPRANFTVEARGVGRMMTVFRESPGVRVVLVEQRREGRKTASRLIVDADDHHHPVTREPVARDLVGTFSDLVQAALGDHSECLAAVLPLWPPKTGGSEVRTVRGLVLVAWTKTPPVVRPGLIIQLDALARTLAAASVSIERAAQRAVLIAWASAGVGPIHQLIKVVEDCRQAAATTGNGELRELIEVFYEQLWILHQFSRHVSRPSPAGACQEPFAGVLHTAVRRAMLLTGEVDPPTIDVSPRAAGALIAATDQTALNAVLSCAISNSVRYGIGFQRVTADWDPTSRTFEIVVRNQTHGDDASLRNLDEARRIAARVTGGQTDTMFLQLVETVDQRGLRGIGTWLAARVTRELLSGSYALDFERIGADVVEVRATIRFADGGAAAGQAATAANASS